MGIIYTNQTDVGATYLLTFFEIISTPLGY